MNRRNLTLVVAGAILLALFANKNLRNRILPTGEFIQNNLPSSEIPVPSQILLDKPQVEIATTKGVFVIELRPDLAPKTVVNFLSKWANGYCNGKSLHRVEDWVVQGCDPAGDGTGGKDSLPTETSTQPFTAGSLGVARKPFPKNVSNDSQFFIVKKDSFFLNGDYTYFGQVVSGMDVVNKLTAGDKIISTTILSK